MMKKNSISISESEWQVLKVLWGEAPLTLPQIAQKLEHTEWSINTIQTFLSRLVKKKAISTQKQGKGFLYVPLVQEENFQLAESQSFIERVYDGSLSSMVLGFIKSGKLTEDEFERLKKLVDEHERGKK